MTVTPNLICFNGNRNYGTPRQRLSPKEVTEVIRKNERTTDINQNAIKYYETNQLASNTPIEDTRAEGKGLLNQGFLFGVYDGHSGPPCSHVVAKRLLSYIAAALLPLNELQVFFESNVSETISEDAPLSDRYNDDLSLRRDLKRLYATNFHRYVETLIKEKQEYGEFDVKTSLSRAFTHLDDDISYEAKTTDEMANHQLLLSIAMSGSVAVVAHVDGQHLHIANSGDSRAIIGSRASTNEFGSDVWEAKVLTRDHNVYNAAEVSRILQEHPGEEQDVILQHERLLGMLQPLRAFGDVRFKWSKEELEKHVTPFVNHPPVISSSLTPPYLTATPEVTYHKLEPKDAFLILATDGLWDLMSSEDAVRLVGEHISGKTIRTPYSVPEDEEITLGQINEDLMKRRKNFKMKPVDLNAATHLIRFALGGTPEGLDNNRLSGFLSVAKHKARAYRDDITVTVIYFDPEYLSKKF